MRVSGNAHLIMPWHVAIDSASERHLGRLQIGTTRRGIGPAYADKAARIGIRVQDILDPKILRQKFETALAEKNVVLERVHEVAPLEVEELAERMEAYAARLRPYVADTSLLVDRALADGKRVLLEGAQGTLLDLDHGTYPFVTSSSPIAGAAATGRRHRPHPHRPRPRRRQGVRHPRRRGPVPHRDRGPEQARVRELGAEYGTTTGRERRCGWLDLVALPLRRPSERDDEPRPDQDRRALGVRRASGLHPLPAPDGSETEDFPAHQSDFHHAEPVYETLSGWKEPLDDAESLADLPAAARAYVAFVEERLGVEVCLISVGAERERVVAPHGLASVAG